MNKNLSKLVRFFIEYDLEATKLGDEKGLKARERPDRERKGREEGTEYFYV